MPVASASCANTDTTSKGAVEADQSFSRFKDLQSLPMQKEWEDESCPGPSIFFLVLSRERKSKDIFQGRSRGHKPPFSKWPGKPFFEPKTGLPGHFVKFMFVAS